MQSTARQFAALPFKPAVVRRNQYTSVRKRLPVEIAGKERHPLRVAIGGLVSWRVLAMLVGGSFTASSRAEGVLDPQGPIASAERVILLNSTTIMLVVVVPVVVLTLAFAWWYRASNTRASYQPNWANSGRIEFVVWSIPAMVVLLLAGVAWIGSHELDPARKLPSNLKPVRIEVVSLDWKWLFIYPDLGVATLNQITVPTGVPIEFVLTSANVMNAFWVPQLGSQIYTMPGMTTRLNLLAEHAGDYPGLSSNFSGDGFSDMRFVVHAVPAAGFSSWIARSQGEGERLDAGAYSRMARTGSDVSVKTYGSVAPGLFEHIERETTGAPTIPMER
jgi:cytochrome o ubiquinol oxidase subunit II